MPSKNVALTITYTAFNTSTNVGQTGDAANHTLKVVVDGTEAAVTGSITEVDSTNLKGAYKVTLTTAQMNGNCVYFGGASSTANVYIVPQTIFTDGGVLPAAGTAPGASGGLPTTDASNGVKLSVGTGTGQVSLTSGGVILAAAGLDSVVVETGINARQALSPILAAAAGATSGAGTSGPFVIKGGNSSTTRVSATVDNSGNRTAVTLTLPT